MAAMIPDDKKEEIREAADLVEVAGDYVKLKRSGRSWKGLCPFHDEKTPSFHVTPAMGIYKCFGCGESGDVFNFMMQMEGVGFVDAMRSLADRFGVSLPEPDEEELDEEHYLREGIYHALKFAGVFFNQQLMETDEAEKARRYLQERGYNRPILKKYGLGYAPLGGDKLYNTAINTGINKQYLMEAGLVKPSNRGNGFYDTFRGRLMFPIFNPSGKVIAFAGRILDDKKGAKYINSPQTKVYNKSEVLYGINFAKSDIRKSNEVVVVEGYTDVISLHQNNIKNVVSSSGTSLTPRQLKILHRYGETIIMIYDSDSAGQKAMKRGINLALAEGLDVKLLELPEGEDPDSFVKQFGKDSFLEMKQEEADDFVSYLIHQAQNKGEWEQPSQKRQTISEVLESIAHIPDNVSRETYVQYLNKLSKVGDRALFDELGKIVLKVERQKETSLRREKRQTQRVKNKPESSKTGVTERQNLPHSVSQHTAPSQKRPRYEKELLRLMLKYDRDMIDYIGSHCSALQFEDEELRSFYADIIERYKQEKQISVEVYAQKNHPYPKLVGEIVMMKHDVSERHHEKIGVQYKQDKNPYATAKGALKALKIHHLESLQQELQQRYSEAEQDDRRAIIKTMSEVGRQRTMLQKSSVDELFPDPESDSGKQAANKIFDYKMKENK